MKKLLICILAAFALVCFAACGTESKSEKPQGNGAQSGDVDGGSIELPEDKFN